MPRKRRRARVVLNRAQQAGMSMEEIFREHVRKTPTHWLWEGRANPQGYGWLSFEGVKYAAARVSYELHIGPIPKGLLVRSTCRLRRCVNPAHLEATTQREAFLVGFTCARFHATSTSCHRGHPWTAENTHVIDKEKGWRTCRACAALRQRCFRTGRSLPNKLNRRQALEQAFPKDMRKAS